MTEVRSGKLRPKVLFVDDEELVLETFERTLTGSGIDVTLAVSAGQGLMAMNANQFGVVLADYHMPGMNGIEFLEEVKQRFPDAVRILVSGKGDFDVAIKVINQVGLFHYIVKPWDPIELKNTIGRAMDHHDLIARNRLLTAQLAQNVAELGRLNSSLEIEIQNRTGSLLFGLINALDLRDTETQSHSRRVALYASRLAAQLELKGNDVLDVERGALLHDIGKIGVSDTILLKPGKLTDEEWVEMRRHSEYGYRIIESIDFLGNARRIVWEHHERWDGEGYPRRLSGDKICVGARIFAVIDTYDAMTSDRPYRKALPHEVAIEEITKMKGTQFDPHVADTWVTVPLSDILGLKERAETLFIGRTPP
jgi:putative nucleotidyltransferase with HDIG domain